MTSPINLENSQAEWLNRLWHIWSPVDVIDRMKPGKAKKVEPGGRKKKNGTGVKLDYYIYNILYDYIII